MNSFETQHRRRAFTLVELVVSMTLFTLFIGVITSTFLFVSRSLREANEMRKVYGEARELMDRLTQDVRLFTVDYDCLNRGSETQTSTYQECVPGVEWPLASLPLISGDGLTRVVYRFKDNSLQLLRLKRSDVEASWSAEAGFLTGFQSLELRAVRLDDAVFRVTSPDVQAAVHVVLSASATLSTLPEGYGVVLQSFVTSRRYGHSF